MEHHVIMVAVAFSREQRFVIWIYTIAWWVSYLIISGSRHRKTIEK